MITENGEVDFTSALSEPFLRPEDEHPDVVPPFSAYSAQGEPEVILHGAILIITFMLVAGRCKPIRRISAFFDSSVIWMLLFYLLMYTCAMQYN